MSSLFDLRRELEPPYLGILVRELSSYIQQNTMKKIAGYRFDRNWTSFHHLLVPYEKDLTIESDSKQKTMSLHDRWNWTDTGPTKRKLQFETLILLQSVFNMQLQP